MWRRHKDPGNILFGLSGTACHRRPNLVIHCVYWRLNVKNIFLVSLSLRWCSLLDVWVYLWMSSLTYICVCLSCFFRLHFLFILSACLSVSFFVCIRICFLGKYRNKHSCTWIPRIAWGGVGGSCSIYCAS